jgi:hypothetical protein
MSPPPRRPATAVKYANPTLTPWPLGLPEQTSLQRSIHAKHWESRESIMFALWGGFSEVHRKHARRLAACGTGARLYVDVQAGRPRPWMSRCGSRLCHFCGSNRTMVIAAQISKTIKLMTRPRKIELTYKSTNEPLFDQIRQLRTAFHRMRRTPTWKKYVRSGIYAIEITRNETTGLWHPHLHLIFDGEFFPQATLVNLWSKQYPGASCQWIREITDPAAGAMEVCKYVGKPPDLQDWPAPAIREFSSAVLHQRMFQVFGFPKGQSPVIQEEKAAQAPESFSVSLPHLMYEANQGNPVAIDILTATHHLWSIFRPYIEHGSPLAARSKNCSTDTGLLWPDMPTGKHGQACSYETGPTRNQVNLFLCHLLDQFQSQCQPPRTEDG